MNPSPTLRELIDPAVTAVVTMECQRGVIGDLATIQSVRSEVVGADLEAKLTALAQEARDAGVLVVHACAVFTKSRVESPTNAPLLRYAASIPGQLIQHSAAAEVVPSLNPNNTDLVSSRFHGVSPFSGTDLDAILKAHGITTVVACGVSLNVGVLGLVIEAVNLGYEVVLPTDGAVAIPSEAAAPLLRNTYSQLATFSSVAEVISTWKDISAG